jgi:hypothetical protein
MYNLDNIVASPTRITKNSVTQTDVIVKNKQVLKCSASVLDFGYSDHLAQTLKINVHRSERGPQMCWKRPKRVSCSLTVCCKSNHGRKVFQTQMQMLALMPLWTSSFIIIISTKDCLYE